MLHRHVAAISDWDPSRLVQLRHCVGEPIESWPLTNAAISNCIEVCSASSNYKLGAAISQNGGGASGNQMVCRPICALILTLSKRKCTSSNRSNGIAMGGRQLLPSTQLMPFSPPPCSREK